MAFPQVFGVFHHFHLFWKIFSAEFYFSIFKEILKFERGESVGLQKIIYTNKIRYSWLKGIIKWKNNFAKQIWILLLSLKIKSKVEIPASLIPCRTKFKMKTCNWPKLIRQLVCLGLKVKPINFFQWDWDLPKTSSKFSVLLLLWGVLHLLQEWKPRICYPNVFQIWKPRN